MGEAEDRRTQGLVLRRLRDMGIEANTLPGGRAVVAELSLGPAPFPGLEATLVGRRVRFVTVGPTQVKCLEPHPLFQLPLLSISGCSSSRTIEQRVRSAWASHLDALATCGEQLRQRGVRTASEARGAQLSLALGLQDPQARARLAAPERIVLPGCGPLTGLPLKRAGERLFEGPGRCGSGTDLQIAITNRLEQLAGRRRKEADRRWTDRAHRWPSEPAREPAPPSESAHSPQILVVGERLGRNATLLRELRRASFGIVAARTSDGALEQFASHSFDLVLADTNLGRGEGIELIPAIQALPGVAHMPIVLVDDRLRPSRRDAARRVGAAGYLVQPVRVASIARGLGRLARGARGRRFDRFPCRLAVRWPGRDDASFATGLGRQGMFVRTEWEPPLDTIEPCEVSLSDLGRVLHFETQIVYRAGATDPGGPGVGVHFRGFADGDEASWIDCVRALARTPDSSARA